MNYLIRLNLFLLFMFCAVSCNGDSDMESADNVPEQLSDVPRLMMQPGDDFLLTPVGHLTEGYRTPEHLDRESVISFIFVQPSDSIQVMRRYEQGRIVELSLDENLSLSARINRNQAMGEIIRNISASILAPYDGVITLSLEEDRMTGNIDLVSENRLFHLRYDSFSELHYLAEIDRSKLDVIEGSDPLDID